MACLGSGEFMTKGWFPSILYEDIAKVYKKMIVFLYWSFVVEYGK